MERVADPLWPVLVLCGLLVSATSALEILAREQGGEPETIRVVGNEVTSISADADDDVDPLSTSESKVVDDDHRRARALARRGELDESRTLFERLVERYPKSGFLRADYGYWLIKAGEYELATTMLERARSLNEDTANVALNLGAARRRLGDLSGAESAYRHALEVSPGYLDAELALARLFKREGKLDAALAVLQKAASVGSNEERALSLFALGRVQLAKHRKEPARRCFQQAVDRAPSSAELRLRIARVWLHDASRDTRRWALEAAESAALLAPDDAKILTALGQAREAVQDRKNAKIAYERALQQAPEEAYPRRRLLRMALHERNFQVARQHANALIRYQPDEPEHHFLRGLVAARDERMKDARDCYMQAIEKAQGDYPEAWFNLGLLEKHAGRFDAAIEDYQKAIELDSKYLAAMNNLGLALASANRFPDAEAIYRRAVGLDAKYTPAWKNLAQLYVRQGRYDEAVEALERALAARPGDLGAARRLAAAKLQAGDVEAALAGFRSVLDKDSENSEAWLGKSRAEAALGRLSAAEDSVSRALALAPDSLDALRQRAVLAVKAGALDAARTAYRDLVDRVPGDMSVRIALAEVLHRAGEYDGCSEEASRVLRVERNSHRAQELKTLCASSTN